MHADGEVRSPPISTDGEHTELAVLSHQSHIHHVCRISYFVAVGIVSHTAKGRDASLSRPKSEYLIQVGAVGFDDMWTNLAREPPCSNFSSKSVHDTDS